MTREERKILAALQRQERQLKQLRRGQSWWLDLSSNVAGNVIFDGALWLLRRLRNLRI